MTSPPDLERKYGPELVAVILACRVFLNTARAHEFNTFVATHDVDWQLFYKMASTHRLRSIIYKASAGLTIDNAIKEQLLTDSKRIALRNLGHFRELAKLIALFEEAGITAVPYKGSGYALQFYDDLSLRESSDLDFLINADANDIRGIAGIMQAQGYTIGHQIPESFLEFYSKHTREFKFLFFADGERKFLAEFHSSLNDPVFECTLPIPNDYLFTGLEEVTLGNHKIKTLSPTNHAIAIITHHGIREQWSSLKNVMDLALAINNGNVNWDTVIACSHKYGFNRVLSIGLQITEDLVGVRRAIPYRRQESIAPWLDNLSEHHLQKTDRTWRYNFLLKLKTKDRFADKVKMIGRHLGYATTPSILDYHFVQLPKPFFFLYLFVKPIRMLFAKKS